MKKVRIIALISAIATGLFAFLYLSSLKRETVTEIERVPVVIAVVDIPVDTAITEEMIKVAQLPAEAVTGNVVSDSSQVVGKLAKSTIYAGEQLLGSKLITTGDTQNNTLSYTIKPGMRAITIGVNATSGLSNMIKPDNHIDIIGEFLLGSSEGKTANSGSDTSSSSTSSSIETDKQSAKVSKTVMVLENINVLAVDSTLSVKDGTTIPYSTITLEVSPEQAMQLSMAQYEGELRVILRSPLDDKVTDEPSITLQDVIE